MASQWLRAFCCAAALLTASMTSSYAQDKIAVATSANSEVTALYVATEEGFFKKRGIDVEVKLIALNPTIPASLISDSIQIGVPTPTVFGQAVDNGLDLVAIAGVSTVPSNHTSVALIARNDLPVNGAKDFIGKTVAVPGFNAILHVAVQMWFEKNGVSAKDVRFVEAPIPQVGDLLKAGRIDAAVGVDPFLARFKEQGVAKHVAYFLREVAQGQQTMYYATTREWAAKNPKAVEAFRAGLNDAVAFIAANPEKAREDMNKYMKLPPEVAKTIGLPETAVVLTNDQFTFWNGVMRKLGLINADLDAKKSLVP